jgi:GTP cyclohydrolase I
MLTKTDKELGQRVKQLLQEQKIESPLGEKIYNQNDAFDIVKTSFKNIMQALNLDLKNESIQNTPERVAKMYLFEVFEGLNYDNFPKCTIQPNDFECDEMVVESGIDVSSVCEHHFQNIEGSAKIGYIPKNKVIGLSKMNRIVRFFSKRPQVQERLTLQIQAVLCHVLETEDVAVEIQAVHHCVKARGIEDKNCLTTTRKLGGKFMDSAVRNEFLNTK